MINKKEKVIEKIEDKTNNIGEDISKLNLSQKIDRITDIIELSNNKKKAKEKNFVLPFNIRSGMNKYEKQNKIIVFLLRENKSMEILITKIVKGMVWLKEDWRSMQEESIFTYKYKGKYYPACIIPEWDLQALIPEKLYQDAVENKRLVAPQTIIIRALKLEETKMKATNMFAGKGIIWAVIGVGILLYMLFGG